MADGEGSEVDSSGSGPSAGADAPTPPMPHRHIDPVVAPGLLGVHHGVIHLGRPRWSTLALIAIFTAALVLYLVLSPG
ncbi:hypothetical protein [Nocardia alba]|uniref:Uncharacterized protein n=1 Tax=Nocardia alba TaxID=225051 RepID=A0A4V6NCS7_9NOCA|nr:hypothetical protein [Nocardia alba]TCJ99485.1 hypothetical protein DFR71_0465 [Nocardia alba]